MRRRATLQDIADYCNLSKSMVAQVIRDPERCKATAKTKSMIASAARELDYQPNFAARALSTNRTYSVGVMFPAIINFYHELTIHLDAALSKHGYSGVFAYWKAGTNSRDSFLEAFERMRRRNVDGIITCQYEESVADRGIPVVTYANERRLMDCVYPDKLDYAARAVRYLMEHGHRNIGCLNYFEDVRHQAICSELKRAGLKVNSDWMVNTHDPHQLRSGYEAMKTLIERKNPPSAIITHCDTVAIGAIRYAHEAGVKIPDDISIISFDNQVESAYTIPALTNFGQPYELAAELLVETLLARIENPALPQQKRSFIMPLIERESVKNININQGE